MNLDVKALNKELARNCMTWKELSEKSGVSTVTLSRINQGKQDAKPLTVGRIANALNVEIETIIKTEDQ